MENTVSQVDCITLEHRKSFHWTGREKGEEEKKEKYSSLHIERLWAAGHSATFLCVERNTDSQDQYLSFFLNTSLHTLDESQPVSGERKPDGDTDVKASRGWMIHSSTNGASVTEAQSMGVLSAVNI